MIWMPVLYAVSNDSRCLFNISTQSSAQRFCDALPHSAGAPASPACPENSRVKFLNISCCICNDDSDALRTPSIS